MLPPVCVSGPPQHHTGLVQRAKTYSRGEKFLLPISENPFPPRRERDVFPGGKVFSTGQRLSRAVVGAKVHAGPERKNRVSSSFYSPKFRAVFEAAFLRA